MKYAFISSAAIGTAVGFFVTAELFKRDQQKLYRKLDAVDKWFEDRSL